MTFDTTNSVLYFYSGSWQGLDPSLQQSDWKDSVRLATSAALPANTRSGNVLTANVNGALTVDGTSVVAGNRILVKNEVTSANNGIYVVTQAGAGGSPWILTRTADANASTKVTNGQIVYVGTGTANAGQHWVLTTADPITINATGQTWTQHQPNTRYFEVNASGSITTTSTSDVLVTSMTLTPGAGTYMVMFTSDWSNNTSGAIMTVSCYQNGSLAGNSQRQYSRAATTMTVGVVVSCIATVAAGQAIDIRWRTTTGTGTMGSRSLSLIKVA
jgi:hypothetical protein